MSVLTLHTTMAALRRQGIDVEAPRRVREGGGARAASSPELIAVSRLVAQLQPTQLDTCAAEVARTHPVLRAMAPFAPTLSAWIEVACRTWRATHPALCWSSSMRRESLYLSFAACAPGLEGFAALTSCVMRHTPALIGGAPLEPLEQTPTSSTYAITSTATHGSTWSHLADGATGTPLRSVLAALAVVAPYATSMGTIAPQPGPLRRDKVRPFSRRHGLTLTETAVLRAIANGARPAEVAVELGISVATVRVHLKHIFTKTGVHRQRQLLAQLDSEAAAFDPGASECAPSA